LIIGKAQLYLWQAFFAEQKIIENSVLTLSVHVHIPDAGSLSEPVKYHWGIYPKLPDKPFSFEYKWIIIHY
jgi:hypothetical protein